jgi:hypothetical protein
LLFSPEALGTSANPFVDENQAARHFETIPVDSACFFRFLFEVGKFFHYKMLCANLNSAPVDIASFCEAQSELCDKLKGEEKNARF